MRVLFINDNTRLVGGCEQVMYQEAELLHAKGHEVLFFTFSDVPMRVEYPDRHNVCVISKKRAISYGMKLFSKMVYAQLSRWIDKHNPDIAHIHHNFISPRSILRALNNKKIPIIQTMHDFHPVCPTSWGVTTTGALCSVGMSKKCLNERCFSLKDFVHKYWTEKSRIRLTKSLVNAFIAPSKCLQETMTNTGWKNVFHIYNFTNEAIQPQMKKNGNLILYVGGLTPQKGVEYLVNAMPEVIKKLSEVKLVIVGEGSEYTKLMGLVEMLGVSNNVEFTGRLDSDKIRRYLGAADVQVIPSIWQENNPLVALDALAYGIPIVGSNIGGIPEVVLNNQTGFLFEPRNINELSEKIIQILTRRDLQKKFSRESKKRFTEMFSKTGHFHQLIQVYKSVL